MTLHVGAGTFLPVKADDTSEHKMHAEWGEIDEATAAALNEVRAQGRAHRRRSARRRCGCSKARRTKTARSGLFRRDRDLHHARLRFRAADLLLTNFHLPRSTLFMLVAAFSGLETMQRAYAHAIATGYRFYSYGDACLLFPGTTASS